MKKLYIIIISHVFNANIEMVKNNIGMSHSKKAKEVSFYEAQLINDGFCIGYYNDNLLIVSPDKVFGFYDKNISVFEKRLCESFPKSDITVLVLNCVVELYGYAIIENGLRKRVKSGADGDVYIDYGKKTEEELEIAKKKIFNDKEIEELKNDYNSVEIDKVIDNEIGIRVANRLLRRFFGKDEKEIYANLSSIKLTEYN